MQHASDFLGLCADAKTRVREVSVDETALALQSAHPPLLIDVREKEEFLAGHIPDAFHLSKGWIEAMIHQVVPDKKTPVILYCGGGYRSLLAGDNIQKMGYTNVRSMTGGFKGWVHSGKACE